MPEGAMRSAPPDATRREEKAVDEEAEVSFSDFTPLPVQRPGGRKKVLGSDRPVRETGSLRSPTKLDVKQRHCPYLGGRSNQEDVTEHPVPQNVCYAKETVEKKLFRTVTLPFTTIPAPRQKEFCLGTYSRCPLLQRKKKEKGNRPSAPAAASPGGERVRLWMKSNPARLESPPNSGNLPRNVRGSRKSGDESRTGNIL